MEDKRKLKILHILPAMNIGGVEVAVQKSYKNLLLNFDYKISTVLFKGKLDCQQISLLNFILNLISKKQRWLPDIVITSLWVSHPFGFICKIFGIKWIAFFHNSSFTHLPDRIVLPLSARYASHCLVDSNATKNFMKTIVNREYFVIPYIFDNVFPVNSCKTNDFIWIGRNHNQKRLDLVYDFVIALSKVITSAKVKLIVSGESYEPFHTLKNIPNWEVEILYSIPNEKVINHLVNSRFYILLSDFEGMSMSTIEAIQNGCVPITRLVGEISNYLDINSAFVITETSKKSLDEMAKQIKDNFEDPILLNQMHTNALKNINNLGTYCDALYKAILQYS